MIEVSTVSGDGHVPIDEELEGYIRDQQRRLWQRWPAGVPVLFPRKLVYSSSV
jgi:hypothetical protein